MKDPFADDPEPEPTAKEACPYCGDLFKSVSRHLPYCDEFQKKHPEKKTEKTSKNGDKSIIRKKLIKMFRAACNGKNYWKKWFPEEFETYGDFQAEFQDLVYKL